MFSRLEIKEPKLESKDPEAFEKLWTLVSQSNLEVIDLKNKIKELEKQTGGL